MVRRLAPRAWREREEALGYPLEPAFFVSDNVAAHFKAVGERGAEQEAAWRRVFRAYAEEYGTRGSTQAGLG